MILCNEDGLCPVCSRNEIFITSYVEWSSGFRFHTNQKDDRAQRGKIVMTLSFPVPEIKSLSLRYWPSLFNYSSLTLRTMDFVAWKGTFWSSLKSRACQWLCANYLATTRMRNLEEKWQLRTWNLKQCNHISWLSFFPQYDLNWWS
jgi:hypothetical protein